MPEQPTRVFTHRRSGRAVQVVVDRDGVETMLSRVGGGLRRWDSMKSRYQFKPAWSYEAEVAVLERCGWVEG
jgi:hypothetical protein